MAQPSELEYNPLPDRAKKAMDSFLPSEDLIQRRMDHFLHVKPRPEDEEGSTEFLDEAPFTHHFILGPSEVIVFLHGIPDSWYQWHHQMADLSQTHLCTATDLKAYGQSEKAAGDYTYEGASEQLFAMLRIIGVSRFNMVTHDRGTIQGDFIAANHPESGIRYGRGEQHLFHFNPLVAPQGDIFMNAPYNGVMEDPKRFVVWVHSWVGGKSVPNPEFARFIQEHSYPATSKAVPCYFNSSSFRAEWLERRNRLLAAWKCPVLVMQGYDSKSQPRGFYEKAREYIPNAKVVEFTYLPGGHFWTLESPKETTEAIRHLISLEA